MQHKGIGEMYKSKVRVDSWNEGRIQRDEGEIIHKVENRINRKTKCQYSSDQKKPADNQAQT
jgi:hypothetical protein